MISVPAVGEAQEFVVPSRRHWSGGVLGKPFAIVQTLTPPIANSTVDVRATKYFLAISNVKIWDPRTRENLSRDVIEPEGLG